jgi:hypothetical protein
VIRERTPEEKLNEVIRLVAELAVRVERLERADPLETECGGRPCVAEDGQP